MLAYSTMITFIYTNYKLILLIKLSVTKTYLLLIFNPMRP